jgi:transcriptional regulator with XRE-family HTH domain
VITVEDWALIRTLAADGVPKKQIAERLGISRTTVVKIVASTEPPKYARPAAAAATFTPFEARVRALLEEHPELPATVLAERVGWSGSITWFRDNVRRLRPEHRRPDPADRLVWAPGDAAQCDLWFPPRRIPLEDGTSALLPVLVIVATHPRFIKAMMLPTRQTPDLLLGMWSLISQLGRVPRRLIWDNEAGIKPHDPESKGIVERRNGFFETSFMPGRTFVSPTSTLSSARGWSERTRARCALSRLARSI